MTDEVLYLDVRELQKVSSNPAVGLMMDLVMTEWSPTRSPFVFDPAALAARVNKVFPKRGYTAELIEGLRPDLLTFFTELPDGRWVPSPRFFSSTDGNAERHQ